MDPICSFRRVLGGVAICRVVTQRIFKESVEQTYPWKPKKLGISPANDSAGVANDCLLLQEQKKCTAACVGEPYFATNNMAGKWVAFGEGVFCNVPRSIAALPPSFLGHSWEDFEDLRLLDAVQESNWVNKSFPRLGIITIYFTSGGPHRDIILS